MLPVHHQETKPTHPCCKYCKVSVKGQREFWAGSLCLERPCCRMLKTTLLLFNCSKPADIPATEIFWIIPFTGDLGHGVCWTPAEQREGKQGGMPSSNESLKCKEGFPQWKKSTQLSALSHLTAANDFQDLDVHLAKQSCWASRALPKQSLSQQFSICDF